MDVNSSNDDSDNNRKRAGVRIYYNSPQNGLEMLLVRGKKHAQWGFPKGTIEPGETAEDCAVRECMEECGLLFSKDQFVSSHVYGSHDQTVTLFDVVLDCKRPPRVSDLTEIDDARWVKVSDWIRLSINDSDAFRRSANNSLRRTVEFHRRTCSKSRSR